MFYPEIFSCYWFLQAYTNELEIEVAHLLEENERLRKQQEQVKNKNKKTLAIFMKLKFTIVIIYI